MTVLNFLLLDEIVFILSDTLLSDADKVQPLLFTSKVHPVPHWQGLITGTGSSPFILDWFTTAVGSLLARDLVHVDQYAPSLLRSLFPKHTYEPENGREITSTIYHFGYSPEEKRFVGFAYRSTDNFESERLPYAFGIKPDPKQPLDLAAVTALPADFIPIAELQKDIEKNRPLTSRVGVGGQLIAYALEVIRDESGTPTIRTTINICHDFSDFEEMYQFAVNRIDPIRTTSKET